MDPPSVRSRAHRFASWATAVASVFITSLWVAIGAVAPEFIWQGLRIAYEHPDWSDLLSALLIGLILAFFVEPATERVRDLLHLARTKTDFVEGRPRNVFFTACLSLAFAPTSVGLHDAMLGLIADANSDFRRAQSIDPSDQISKTQLAFSLRGTLQTTTGADDGA